ncbi:hypothetical protein DVJ77_17195 [Dyella tabacisoli]|uniref:Uncharacterized protein n=2 Tax=Dyella tabacisoli TaxID=2282381 RepID=A0A369UIP5_9GAMM|nr:hypothetical protein DVJ77_17195 [Dyella tabacisoli]
MTKRAKFKIVVGEGKRQSEVWTVSLTKNDVYLASSGAKHTKISLHESGQGSWSIRSEVLDQVPFVPTTGRHLALWNKPKVSMGHLSALFYLLFPDSELRPRELRHDVPLIRIPSPGKGAGVRIDFALSPPLDAPPDKYPLDVQPPLSLLFSHQLANRQLLVASWHVIPIPDSLTERMDRARAMSWAAAVAQGRDPVGTKAAASVTDRHGIPGFIEVAPNGGMFGVTSLGN